MRIVGKFKNHNSTPGPSPHSHFYNCEQHAYRGHKPFGTLPVLLMTVHAPLQDCQPAAIAVTHQTRHLRLQNAQIAQHLCLEFIDHTHPLCPTHQFVAKLACAYLTER